MVQVLSETGGPEQSEWVKPLAQMQRHWLFFTTVVPPFWQGWELEQVGAVIMPEAAFERGMTTRVIGMTTAAAMRRRRMIIRRITAHSGIPQHRRRKGGLSSEREEL